MERFNKITLRDELVRPPKAIPITLNIQSTGKFCFSVGLYNLMERPEFVEFVYDKGLLYLMSSTEELGFKVRTPSKGVTYTFSCKPVCKRFFKSTKQRCVVFTEPLENANGKMFQVNLLNS